VSTSLSDSGLLITKTAQPGRVPFSTGNAPADSILSAGAAFVQDSWDVGPEHSGVGAEYLYGVSGDFLTRFH